MAENKILEELRAKLTDSAEDNNKFLRAEAERFAREKNLEGVDAATQLLIELMPEEQKAEIDRLTHIDGMRLDEMHDRIMELIREKNTTEAKSLAERLYKKIILDYKDTENSKFVSLRNPFEDNLYQLRYKSEKVLNRTPFDFGTFITTYGYLLVETGSPLDAIPVLEKAIEYNPLDCGPRFELAEVYKLLKNKRMTLETTRETLKVASSPVAIARCYANAGYALTDMGEYDDAFVFLAASVFFAPHPAIPHEMRDLVQRKGKPIKQPSRNDMIEVMKKYNFEFGPNQDVVSVAAQLSANYLMDKDIPNALKALKMTYNLTRDEKVKEIILTYEPDAPMVAPRHDENDGEPMITQTLNGHAEIE
ncbi:tetratricopeptide repeat protein [Ruminococcus sp.]|uniref:tetratricopeptide repeat protein n=1 Tax=Ruminococcus sp. TaxID=41978 RepID=UPI001B41B410|nr:tetratricopeptide repeat protein [Ruminococcus sp.]MBP5431750.1 tetratricopeptide repeat protein [Ruminococcus sp.]